MRLQEGSRERKSMDGGRFTPYSVWQCLSDGGSLLQLEDDSMTQNATGAMKRLEKKGKA